MWHTIRGDGGQNQRRRHNARDDRHSPEITQHFPTYLEAAIAQSVSILARSVRLSKLGLGCLGKNLYAITSAEFHRCCERSAPPNSRTAGKPYPGQADHDALYVLASQHVPVAYLRGGSVLTTDDG